MRDDELLDDPRLTAMGLLIEVHQGLVARLDPVHAERGLAGSDFDALIRLARSPERRLRMSDLAAQTALSTSGVTRVVDRLERRRLVTREPCPTDRRTLFATLSPDGAELLRSHLPAVVDIIERWFTGPLTAGQSEALFTVLHTVRDRVHPDATAGSAPPAGQSKAASVPR